jgi:hypothetical protein
MNDDNFENLAKKHPDLFHKTTIGAFEINDGWYNIIDVLCDLISWDVTQARARLQYAIENKKSDKVTEYEELLARAVNDLPVITQVKEKFGGLRFYTSGSTPKINNYITFAEHMAMRTCEVCGNPGKTGGGSWVKVLCDTHHAERQQRIAESDQKPLR